MALLLTAAASAWADEPTVYTSEVQVAALKEGDILADGFSLDGDDGYTICFIANRYKEGGENQHIDAIISLSDITSYGANGAISVTTGSGSIGSISITATITPVDEYEQVGNAWVVTGFVRSDYDNSIVGIQIGGITYGSTPTDSPIVLTSTDGKVWTLASTPGYDVELEMEYYDQATLTAAPTAATGLEYSGEAQNLITTAGTATGGTLYYGLGTSDAAPTDARAWSETVPTGTTVGMYYVWYKVVGDATHGDIAPAPLSVNIAKATPTISEAPTAGAITYGQTLAASTLDGGSATYNSQTIAGSFAWTTLTTVPSVSDSQTTGYSVTFTPTDGNYNSATTTVTLTVNPASAEGLTLTLSSESFTYNGEAQEPTVTVKDGETTLTLNTDYSVSYSNNTNAALSTAENAPTVTITGMGNYSGTASKKFTIAPKSLTDGMIQTITDQIYTGAAIEPSVVVKDGETTLTQDTHYTVSYSNNTNAALSTASENAPTVTVTGMGNYSGLITKTFTINKATATISYATTEVSKVFGDAAFINTLTKTPATGTGLGTVAYTVTAETKDADCTSDHVATIDASTGEVTITGTGSATITATATDGDNYTYGSTTTATYTLTVAKGTITASATGGNYSYSASGSHAITVSVTKPSSGYTIKYGTTAGNYELTTNPSYSTIGTHTTYYKVSAPNYNDFTGQATVTINKASGSLSFASSSLTKTYGDDNFVNALYKTGDGAVTYSSTRPAVATVDASTGLVTIKGTGTTTIRATMSATDAYSSDYATFSLTVNAASLTGAMVTLSQTSYDYDGTAKEPTVSAVILNGKVLTSSDYDVSYSNNTNAGTATVTVTGKGNYTGTASQTFTIASVTTTDGNITVVDGGSETVLTINDMGNQQGKTVTPDLQVTTLNYYRSLNASDESVYTVCLPYAPKTDASLKYYTLTGCEGTTLKFDEITGAPQAYTPYLVSASKTTDIGTENLNQPITMSQTVDNSFSAGNYVMKGSLSGFTHDQSVGKYILQSGNRWGLVGSDTHAYIPPFRAYIEATVSGARLLDSSFYDEATGIYSLRTVDRDGTERYYDLNGRRIDDPKKTGIYIRNGRKEVLK